MTDSGDLDFFFFFCFSIVKICIHQHFIHLKPNFDFSLKVPLYSVTLYYSNLYFYAIFESKMPPSPPTFKPTHIHSQLSPIRQHSVANSIPKLLLKMQCSLLSYLGILAVFK